MIGAGVLSAPGSIGCVLANGQTVGNLMAVSPGETVRLWGQWVDDKKWGRQLRVDKYDRCSTAKYSFSPPLDGRGISPSMVVTARAKSTLSFFGPKF